MTESTSRPAGETGNYQEELSVSGIDLVTSIRDLLVEGTNRRLVVEHNTETLLNIPLEAGILGAVFAPPIAAVATVGALLTNCTIKVLRGSSRAATPTPARPQMIEVEKVEEAQTPEATVNAAS